MSKQLGQLGEDIATRYLAQKGYRVLARNWRTTGVEVDIITRDGDEVVFVEVKTRQTDVAGYPEDSVTSVKRHHLERVAQAWLVENAHGDTAWRVDVIAIRLFDNGDQDIVHFEGI